MIRFLSIRLATGLACMVLASCAMVKEQTTLEPPVWRLEQQKRQQINAWEIRGRLGVQTVTNGGSVDIIWKQLDEEFLIRLIAPLGAGTYLIQGNNSYAEIRHPDGRTEAVSNVDDVFASSLDVDLPLTAIKDWIRGIPAHTLSVEAISWNEQGLLHRAKQSGWNVEMTKYIGTKVLLPHAIYLSHDDNAELDIRLVLRQWMLDY